MLRLGVSLLLVFSVFLILPYFIVPVQAAEPSLVTILTNLGFTNINLTDIETFSACTYNITLYAEFAGYCDENELSFYELDDPNVFNVIFTGPEGGSGYIDPITEIFTADYEFGLSMLSPGPHRYYTETFLNGDGLQHAVVYENLDEPGMFLIGFENQWEGGDKDYNDMVFSLKPVEYNLTITTTIGGTTDPLPSTYSYCGGSEVEVTAYPDPCYQFDHWELDTVNVGSTNPYTVTMDADHTLHAVFIEINYTLTITSTAGGTTDPSPSVYQHPCCTNVQVTAIPDLCYQFDHWELDSSWDYSNPIIVHMDANYTLRAVFVQETFWLTIEVGGTGNTNPSPGVYQYNCCEYVSVSAVETDPCWGFDHWKLDTVNVGSANPYTVHMDMNHTLKAVFVQKTFGLTIQVDGTGTTDPAPGTYEYNCCEYVSVIAIETDPCWNFDHWELDGSPASSANPIIVHIDDNHTLQAVFIEINYTLTITSTAGGTTDPSSGVYQHPCSSSVQVTAYPDPCYQFDHWELDTVNVGSDNPYTLTMDDDHSLHAVFTPIDYTLTINIVGDGSVTKNPDQLSYPCGTQVTLTAVPDLCWAFSHWGGDLTGSTNPKTITMDSDKTVTVHFIEEEYTLTINIVGSGSVTKYPNQATYPCGTVVTLTALSDANWTFSHWSGDLSGSANPETITMNGDKTVTAHFTSVQPPTTVGGEMILFKASKPSSIQDHLELLALFLATTVASIVLISRKKRRQ